MRRTPALCALAMASVLSFCGILNHDLFTPDEPRVAAISSEMLRTGNVLVPTLAGRPFLEKPPLYFLVTAASLRLFGVTAGAARLPAALFGFATLFLVFDLGRRVRDAALGFASLMVLGSFAGFYLYMHRCLVDTALTFFITLGWWAFCRRLLLSGTPDSRPSAGLVLTFYAAAGLAAMTKGPVGPIILLAPCFLVILRLRALRSFVTLKDATGFALFLLIALLWPLALWLFGHQDLLLEMIRENVVQRIHAPPKGQYMGGHRASRLYYIYRGGPPLLLPWLAILPALVGFLRKSPESGFGERRVLLASAAFLPICVVLLSLPDTKRALYLLPTLPPLALPVADWLLRADKKKRTQRVSVALVELLLFSVCLIVTALLLILCLRGTLPFATESHFDVGWPYPAAALATLAGLLLLRRWMDRLRLPAEACAVMVMIGVLVFPVIDQAKSLRGLSAAVAPHLSGNHMAGYLLDETIRGVLSFDLGKTPRDIRKPEKLLELLADRNTQELLVPSGRVRYFPSAALPKLRLLRELRYPGGRSYRIYRIVSGEPVELSRSPKGDTVVK